MTPDTSDVHERAAAQDDSTLADVSVLADPSDYYRALRSEDHVHFDPKLNAYLVSRYEDLETVLRDTENYSLERAWNSLWSEDFKAILARDGGGYFPDAIMTDPPTHTRVRGLMGQAFTAHRIKQLESVITGVAVDIIETLADRGKADGVMDLAKPMTIQIMAHQLGMTDVDPATILRWSTAFAAQIGRMLTHDDMVENAKIVCECQHFVIDLVKQRQAQRSEDLVSDLVYARTEDGEDVFSFGEIVASARAFMIGGIDSISTAISNLLFTLATRPDLAEELHASLDDDRVFSRFVEELIRIAPPARATARIAIRDVTLAGQMIPEGSLVMTMFGSANDDETQFPSPREFDMNRPNLARHMGFGSGIHKCVGVALARMEVKVVAREIVRRLKDITLTIPVEEIPYKLNIADHSIEWLPLSFSRRD